MEPPEESKESIERKGMDGTGLREAPHGTPILFQACAIRAVHVRRANAACPSSRTRGCLLARPCSRVPWFRHLSGCHAPFPLSAGFHGGSSAGHLGARRRPIRGTDARGARECTRASE